MVKTFASWCPYMRKKNLTGKDECRKGNPEQLTKSERKMGGKSRADAVAFNYDILRYD